MLPKRSASPDIAKEPAFLFENPHYPFQICCRHRGKPVPFFAKKCGGLEQVLTSHAGPKGGSDSLGDRRKGGVCRSAYRLRLGVLELRTRRQLARESWDPPSLDHNCSCLVPSGLSRTLLAGANWFQPPGSRHGGARVDHSGGYSDDGST